MIREHLGQSNFSVSEITICFIKERKSLNIQKDVSF